LVLAALGDDLMLALRRARAGASLGSAKVYGTDVRKV
jgi:hypothetical protein